MQTTEEIVGTIDRLLFQSNDNGFAVFVVQTKNSQPITVRGYLPSIHPGEQVTIRGSWVVHPKFGKQFQADECSTHAPTSIVGLKKYLASGLIKGIGPVYAEKLVNYFGANVLEIIDQNPERLQEVPGIGKGRVQTIVEAWSDQREIANIMVFLQDKGITTAYAAKIYKKYGQRSVELLQENPYRLAEDIWGIGFKMADTIAQNLGIAHDSIKRIRAGMLHVIATQVSNGNLYVELKHLKETTLGLLELDATTSEQKISQALHDLYENKKIALLTHNQLHYITLIQYYYSEKGLADRLRGLCEYQQTHTFDLNAIYHRLRTPQYDGDILLNEEQQSGVMNCLQNKVTIITGGPGTGKTTLIKKLLSELDAAKQVYKLAAPTGRAAKRINQSTGKHATTLHRLLAFDVSTYGFAHNENNALKLNFLIIDEASMIDIFLAHAISKALPLHAHLVLIGDIDQLPSVGAGNFLRDIIASKKVPTIRLQHIFRQAQDSLIIVNAHRVNNGEFPVSTLPNAKKDFIFIKEDDPAQVESHLRTIFSGGIQRRGIQRDQAMVLVPMNRGLVGTYKLNYDLQNIINPKQDRDHVNLGNVTFKVGDRVMQIRNNYDKIIFNGDVGSIERIDTREKILHVNFLGKEIAYDFTELNELVLAYAITIHKSQGSEYSAVIIPLFMQHFTLLQRNLIYTALTRAKKLCIIIGQTKALAMAIKNNKGTARTTFLTEFLTTDLQCR